MRSACQIALAAEHKIALDREIDALADDHGDHIRAEVRQTAVGGIVAQNVPLKRLAKERHRDARPAEVDHRQAGKRLGQKLQQQVLEHSNQIRHDGEQATLAHPLGCGRMLFRKGIPKLHASTFLSAVAQAAFQLRVEDDVFNGLDDDLQQTDDPEAFASSTMPSTMPMLMAPLVILASARSGMLYWNITFRFGLPRL